MNKKKKIVTIVCSILILILCIGIVAVHKNIEIDKQIEEFDAYVSEVKEEMKDYIIEDQKEKYEELITKAEKVVSSKSAKDIYNLKEEISSLKEDILKINIELIDVAINEIEAIDLSKLEEKESIQRQIEEIKKLKEDNKFEELKGKLEELAISINDKLILKNIAIIIDEISNIYIGDMNLEENEYYEQLTNELQNAVDEKDFECAKEIKEKIISLSVKVEERKAEEKLMNNAELEGSYNTITEINDDVTVTIRVGIGEIDEAVYKNLVNFNVEGIETITEESLAAFLTINVHSKKEARNRSSENRVILNKIENNIWSGKFGNITIIISINNDNSIECKLESEDEAHYRNFTYNLQKE